MRDAFVRTEMLLGPEAMERLAATRIAVFGLGGVGGYVAEALARSGVGALDLVDDDRICVSNLNRQILATTQTLGRPKAEAAAERVRSINPDIRVTVHQTFFLPETEDRFDFREYDYVADCIDTVTGKLALVRLCMGAGTPIISAMGTGNKLDPTLLRVSDIYETSGCPLARIMRKELRRRGIPGLTVVWSPEEPIKPLPCPAEKEDSTHSARRSTPGSSAFVPPAAGLIMASRIVRDLTAKARGKMRS